MPRNRKGNRHEAPGKQSAAHASLSSQSSVFKEHAIEQTMAAGRSELPSPGPCRRPAVSGELFWMSAAGPKPKRTEGLAGGALAVDEWLIGPPRFRSQHGFLEKTTEANFFRNRPDRLPRRLPRRHCGFTKGPGSWKPTAQGDRPTGPCRSLPLGAVVSPDAGGRQHAARPHGCGLCRPPKTGVRDFPFAPFGIRPERQA